MLKNNKDNKELTPEINRKSSSDSSSDTGTPAPSAGSQINEITADWPAGLIDITDRLVIREFTEEDSDLCRDIYISCDCMSDSAPAEMSPDEFRDFHRAYIKYQYGFYGYGNWGVFLRNDLQVRTSASEPNPVDYSDVNALTAIMKASTVPVGMVGIKNGSASQVGELSYVLLPEYRNKGYAFEACNAALEYGKECGFISFEARIAADNLPSLRLAEKLGVTILPG